MGNFAMRGAILGDIIGSTLEFGRPNKYNAYFAPLLLKGSHYTDDTVMTCATAAALLEGAEMFAPAYKAFGAAYPGAGYGGMFGQWLRKDGIAPPYGSFGNGSAMRIAPVGDYVYANHYCDEDIVHVIAKGMEIAERSAACTHDHPEGIKGAQATVYAILLAYGRYDKETIVEDTAGRFSYDEARQKLSALRQEAVFDETCQSSLPLALACFRESNSYTECLRNVMSCKCDTDTVGAIAGAIAGAYYQDFQCDIDAALRRYLPDGLWAQVEEFDSYVYT